MKLRFFYYTSFWFGVVYLFLTILTIPAMLVLFQAEGIHLATITQFGISEIIFLLASPVSGILACILMIFISLALVRNKIVGNNILNIGAVILSVTALVVSVLVVRVIFLFTSTQSIEALVGASNITYPLLPILFAIGVVSYTVGYVKEELKTSPRKYLGVVLVSSTILVIFLLKLVEVFH